AGHRLVEQEKPRLAGERHRNLELAVLAVAQTVDAVIGPRRKPDGGERCKRRVAQGRIAARIFPEMKRVAGAGLDRERNIVERGEIRKQQCNLKRARESEPAPAVRWKARNVAAVEADAAGFGRNLPAEQR